MEKDRKILVDTYHMRRAKYLGSLEYATHLDYSLGDKWELPAPLYMRKEHMEYCELILAEEFIRQDSEERLRFVKMLTCLYENSIQSGSLEAQFKLTIRPGTKMFCMDYDCGDSKVYHMKDEIFFNELIQKAADRMMREIREAVILDSVCLMPSTRRSISFHFIIVN